VTYRCFQFFIIIFFCTTALETGAAAPVDSLDLENLDLENLDFDKMFETNADLIERNKKSTLNVSKKAREAKALLQQERKERLLQKKETESALLQQERIKLQQAEKRIVSGKFYEIIRKTKSTPIATWFFKLHEKNPAQASRFFSVIMAGEDYAEEDHHSQYEEKTHAEKDHQLAFTQDSMQQTKRMQKQLEEAEKRAQLVESKATEQLAFVTRERNELEKAEQILRDKQKAFEAQQKAFEAQQKDFEALQQAEEQLRKNPEKTEQKLQELRTLQSQLRAQEESLKKMQKTLAKEQETVTEKNLYLETEQKRLAQRIARFEKANASFDEELEVYHRKESVLNARYEESKTICDKVNKEIWKIKVEEMASMTRLETEKQKLRDQSRAQQEVQAAFDVQKQAERSEKDERAQTLVLQQKTLDSGLRTLVLQQKTLEEQKTTALLAQQEAQAAFDVQKQAEQGQKNRNQRVLDRRAQALDEQARALVQDQQTAQQQEAQAAYTAQQQAEQREKNRNKGALDGRAQELDGQARTTLTLERKALDERAQALMQDQAALDQARTNFDQQTQTFAFLCKTIALGVVIVGAGGYYLWKQNSTNHKTNAEFV